MKSCLKIEQTNEQNKKYELKKIIHIIRKNMILVHDNIKNIFLENLMFSDEDLTLDLQHPWMLWHASITSELGKEGKRIPEANWLTSLDKLMNSRFSERRCLKQNKMWRVLEEDV